MHDAHPEELFDPQKGLPEPDEAGQGDVSHGTDHDRPTASEGDSPNHGSVDGPLAPQPLPGDGEAVGHSEMRGEREERDADGVATFTRMASDAVRRDRGDAR